MPPVHEIQKDSRFNQTIDETDIDAIILTTEMQSLLAKVRAEIVSGEWDGPEPGTEAFNAYLFAEARSKITKKQGYTLTKVINATGTILHTNLGRARLSDRAVRHVVDIAQNYSNLEYKLTEGERGSRHSHVESLIKTITGAEAAMVVNNNAAAVFLILKALANGEEVIVSRGQLVEIGGSFRISSIMEESGANLTEVGTTNKTHLYDYERAICDETRMILKVHTSNFKIIGFTKSVDTAQLAELAKQQDIIFYEDLGSGVLYDFSSNGIGEEPVVGEVLRQGADIVSFSGDKLLGGPQAGIIAGKKSLIEKLKKHQLARVLRVDKMTLAALEGTLVDYARGERGIREIPAVRDLLTTSEELKGRIEELVTNLEAATDAYSVKIQPSTSQVGGGTMPDVELPTFVAAISHKDMTVEQLSRSLRLESHPPIITRIQKEELILDLRTVGQEEAELILQALIRLA